MHSALDTSTRKIVEAEDLWEIELTGGVDKDRYACIGCEAKLWPMSYKPENIPRPYFQMRDPTTHKADCDVEKQVEWIRRGKTKRLTNQETGFPARYPSRLVLRTPRLTGAPDIDATDITPAPTATSGGQTRPPADNRTERQTEANTIRPICRSFINFPYDRDRVLEIPGVEAKTYLTAFRKLKWDTLAQLGEPKLFYAELAWSAPIRTDDHLEVTLSAGEWGDSKAPQWPFRVRVDWRNWSKTRRTVVAKEIDATRKEGPRDSKEKGYLFFIGAQDRDDLTLIHVNDHRLVCSLAADIQYPNFK
ncbi:hypothetical protein [Paraburkholderia terricola]|jgi:hypothetical protein|uniref:hypothetical protein n=1 Tax=Paraburkholderia terricola TaxID=169427 RepID=UPI000DEF6EC4|nr:hypothetical protein [Paraburkholderia terricola]AXE91057.1 hypothetical protein CUJ90_00815 [Paraburkholderia terricola]